MQGQLDTPLDDLGRLQADEAACHLASLRPWRLLTSDLCRAADIAAPLGRATGLVPVVDARLRELRLGTWQGLTHEQAAERYPDEHTAWRTGSDVARGGGETYREAGARAVACLSEHLPDLPPGGTLLAVTHGGTARATIGTMLELPATSWGRLAPLGNACWSVLVEADWGWRLERHGAGLDLSTPREEPPPRADGRAL